MKFHLKLNSILICTCLGYTLAHGQNWYPDYDVRLGGTLDDSPSWIEKSNLGGFIIGGTSKSNDNGDKSQPNWDSTLITSDYWIVRLDDSGNKIWDKRFGGNASDILVKVLETTDGGIILAGNSFSGVSGDKSQPNWDSSQQSIDFWIVKTDVNGNKMWDTRLGGNSLELIGDIIETPDQGYLIAGSTFSGISGNITQGSRGFWDYWVVRLDAQGNIVWDQRYGGPDNDFVTAIDLMDNGDYIIGGYSQSNVGSEKSEACRGQWDYWILRVDGSGNPVWDKTYGGDQTDWLFDLIVTSDNNIVMGGQSFSNDNGEKSEPNIGTNSSTSDRWVIKTNGSGTIMWDRTIGGSLSEDLSRIQETQDRGFLISGESSSGIRGNKSEDNLGFEQSWVVKTDSSGMVVWDKTIFTTGHDEEGIAILSDSNCFINVNYTEAAIGGYKSQSNWGEGDIWLVRICESPTTGINQNHVFDENIRAYPNPTSHSLFIESTNGYICQLHGIATLSDMFGRIIQTKKVDCFSRWLQMETEVLEPGNYVVSISIDSKCHQFIITKAN
ncbi:MAG: hypothetical protein ACKOYC_10320 [Bacteroidota bacterium]